MAFSTTPTSGNDRLTATAENQTIDALAGNDWITSVFDRSRLFGGDGHDRITVALSLPEPTEADYLRSAALYGGNGDDWLVTELFAGSREGVWFRFDLRQYGGRGNDVLFVSAATTAGELLGGGDYNIDLYGGAGSDDIWIESAEGGGFAHSFVDAGCGADTVYIYVAGTSFNGGGTNEVVAGSGDDDVTVRADSGFFSSSGNILWGGAGDDRLDATMDGTGGLNDLHGGNGNDLLIADAGVASDSASTAHNKVSGDDGDDVLSLKAVSYGNLAIVRNEGYGGGGNDRITAVAGVGTEDYPAETLLSLGTLLRGGSGDDVLTATTFFYVLYDEPAGGAELYGGSGDDVLRVYGGVENTLDGGAGDDVITGGSGADRIIGGAGADGLRGGGGDDAFVFLWMTGAALATRDTIFDFGVGTAARGDDVIDLSAIDADATVAGNQAFAFGGTARKGVGYVWVEESTTGSGSLVMANGGGTELLVIAVEDGAGRDAADWRADDFVL